MTVILLSQFIIHKSNSQCGRAAGCKWGAWKSVIVYVLGNVMGAVPFINPSWSQNSKENDKNQSSVSNADYVYNVDVNGSND